MKPIHLYSYYHISDIAVYTKLFDKIKFMREGVVIIYLHGPVGAGKTTLVSMLSEIDNFEVEFVLQKIYLLLQLK